MLKNKYDLEERTLKFAKDCVELCRLVPKDTVNIPLIDQLIRASGSVGANYREANNAITRKDFYYRIKICRKEAKEASYWLELLLCANKDSSNKANLLQDEAMQLARIFSAISINI